MCWIQHKTRSVLKSNKLPHKVHVCLELQLASTMRTAFLCESVTVDCWKDYAMYVVELDSSSQGIQTLYRKRMQQRGMFGKMTKPSNCAKYLMIEQPTIYSNISFPFRPSSSNMATEKERKQQHINKNGKLQWVTLTIHHKLSSKLIFQKSILVLPRKKFKVHTGRNIRLASPAIWHSGSIHSYVIA